MVFRACCDKGSEGQQQAQRRHFGCDMRCLRIAESGRLRKLSLGITLKDLLFNSRSLSVEQRHIAIAQHHFSPAFVSHEIISKVEHARYEMTCLSWPECYDPSCRSVAWREGWCNSKARGLTLTRQTSTIMPMSLSLHRNLGAPWFVGCAAEICVHVTSLL